MTDAPAPTPDPTPGRLSSQLLAGPPARSVAEVVGRLLAVQAQDGRGFRLAIRSRTSGLVATDVDEALGTRRSVVVTWLNRGTLHLVMSEDYWWLHPLTAPRTVPANRWRLGQEGVDGPTAERGVDVVAGAVADEGPLTRADLRRRLDRAGVPTGGQALVHLLIAASLRGLVVRGPVVGTEQAYVSVPDWLGPPPPPLARADALARLAQRYLAGHQPATARDLAGWAGITLGDACRGLEALGPDAVGGEAPPAPGGSGDRPLPPPRPLGPFDPVLHGWTSRRDFVGDHSGVVTTNGIFRPVALVGGRVVATWGLVGGVVTLHPLETLDPGTVAALDADAGDVLRFLGLPPRPLVVG